MESGVAVRMCRAEEIRTTKEDLVGSPPEDSVALLAPPQLPNLEVTQAEDDAALNSDYQRKRAPHPGEAPLRRACRSIG